MENKITKCLTSEFKNYETYFSPWHIIITFSWLLVCNILHFSIKKSCQVLLKNKILKAMKTKAYCPRKSHDFRALLSVELTTAT